MEGNLLLGDGELSTSPSQLLTNQVSNEDQMIFKKRVQDHFIARGLISKQFISSYNEFVTNDLVRIILAHNPVWSSESNRCMLKFSNPRLGEPDYKDETTGVVHPFTSLQECLEKKITYAAPLMVDVDVYALGGRGRTNFFVRTITHSNVCIGRIPIMVRGVNCIAKDVSPDDSGGYYIIKGEKKIILLREIPEVDNQFIIRKDDNRGRITCKIGSIGWIGSISSRSEVKVYRIRGKYMVDFNRIQQPFPIVTILKALGLVDTHIITDWVAPDKDQVFEAAFQRFAESLMPQSYKHFHHQKQALNHVGDKALLANSEIFSRFIGKRHKKVKQLLMQMMPHLTVEANEFIKQNEALEISLISTAKLICLMTRKLIQAELHPQPQDYKNIRIELPCLLMGDLFEKLFIELSNEMIINVVEEDSLSTLDGIITDGFDYSMLTGDWDLGNEYVQEVTQTLPNESFVSTSSLSITANQVSGVNPYIQPTDDFQTQTDFFLLKELNVLTQVTSRNEEGAIKDILFKKKSISGESFLHYDPDKVFMGDGNILPKYNIFLNDKFIGTTYFSNAFEECFRSERRNGSIPYTASVYVEDRIRTITIFCDSGRLTRPYIRVENGAPVATFDKICQNLEENPDTAVENLIREGIIEFVDGYERENRAIVSFENDITDDTTHLELLPPLRLDTTYERYLQILEEP